MEREKFPLLVQSAYSSIRHIKLNHTFQKKIVNKKLNDSLYISTINILGPNEVMVLEVAYTQNYEIKQVRHQAVWIDYIPKGDKPLQYIPILYRYPAPKDKDVKY